ncbi:hypothetical protein SAMN05216436_108116 [bacterium A37T11]|nr:hypothetical protein SAMN05216436_108116 [bacterium A37T11]
MARQALNNFKKMADELLATKTHTIINALTGNANYDPAVLDLTSGTTLLADFETKLSAARRKGSPLETSIKNESRQTLEEWLRVLTFQVNIQAGSSLPVLLSSGFDISTPRSAGLPPETPSGLKLGDGRQRGQMRLDFNPVVFATGYEYRFTAEVGPDGQPVWGDRLYTTSSRNNVLTPVTATKIYFAQVRAINTHGASDWSYTLDCVAR